MRVCYFDSAAQVGQAAAVLINAQLLKKPESVLGLATGSTPVPTYNQLIHLHSQGVADFSKAVSYNLDEYVGIAIDHECSYHRFMDDNLFNHVNMRREAIHVPDGLAEDLDAAAAAYDEAIDAAGGIDIQVLGIGRNGHIGFNEPDDHFARGTHVVDLTESTIEANSRLFDSIDDVPRQAMSMGIQTIMLARRILVLASGADKAQAVHDMVFGLITPKVPASILQLHPNCTVIADEAALSLC